MSLVEYCASSGEESGSEDEQSAPDTIKKSAIKSIEIEEDKFEEKQSGLFCLLPAPKKPNIQNEPEEIDESPIVGPKKPKPPVKISIPSLKQFENDEDEQHQKKKFKPSDTVSGLLGMLPKPSNISIKEAGRKLTPHIFSRKVEKPIPKKKAETKPVSNQSTSDDEEITDFFSLSASEMPTLLDSNDIPSSAKTIIPSLILNITPEVNTSSPWNNIAIEKSDKQFNSISDQGETSTDKTANFDDECGSSLISEQDLLNDERFFRLQGKKARKREEINFIDINGSDQMPKPEEWLKSISTEQSHRPMHKKGSMPSSQQRRKHQITYLAFQAKERELELKNQWAMNRLTRQQTQSKYGF